MISLAFHIVVPIISPHDEPSLMYSPVTRTSYTLVADMSRFP